MPTGMVRHPVPGSFSPQPGKIKQKNMTRQGRTVIKSRYKGKRPVIIQTQKKDNKEDLNMSVLTVTKTNFQEEVIRSDKPVLLDFWASWCGPCRMVSPIVDEIAAERGDIKVGKINVDEQPELAAQFGVMSIPTLVVMKEGKIVNQAVGARPKNAILGML